MIDIGDNTVLFTHSLLPNGMTDLGWSKFCVR